MQTLYAADPVNAIVTFKEFADALKQEGTVGYQVIDALRAQGDPAGIGFAQMLGRIGLDSLIGDAGKNTLHGTSGDDFAYGMGGNDNLYGNAGSDHLEGGTGNDYLAGGAGNDVYQFNLGDGADEILDQDATAGNIDTLRFGAGIAPADITLTRRGYDMVVSINGTGDQLTLLNWGDGSNCLIERFEFADGSVWDAAQMRTKVMAVPVATAGDDVLFAWAGESLQGLAGNDTLNGTDGDERLDGGAGADTMQGGLGNDTYVVDNLADIIIEASALQSGTDTVETGLTYSLAGVANVENLTLTGADAVNGTGNELSNVLTGNAAANILDGGAGRDTLYGGAGDDTLLGGFADDRLDGGAGSDTVVGGLGNDTYVIDNIGDVVTENVNEGADLVQSGISYTLTANVENLTLTGTENLNATGNDINNAIRGNSGNNRIDGGLGSDAMYGGAGDDYYITNVGDIISETVGQGIDTIERNYETTLVLERNVENLVLTGAAIHGNGNELDNVVTGNAADNNMSGLAGNDTLDGGAGNDSLFGGTGADTLIGGAGDDYYEIDNAGDTIIEAAGEGNEMVRSTVSFALGDNIERLAVDGVADLSATGNALDNGLWGNAGNNILTGGTGNDYLVGGAGNDVYVFNRGDGQDSIDNTDLLGTTDTLRFGAGIADTDVVALQIGTDIFLNIKGTNDQIALINYYGADTVSGSAISDHKIDRVEFANGVVWDQAMIQSVVDRANTNLAPTINSYLPILQARADSVFTYTVAADTIIDPNPWDSVNYSATMPDSTALPAWLTFDPATRTFAGTPTAADVGALQFILWGTDNYGYGTGEYVTLNIGAPNHAPLLAAALPDQAATLGSAFSYTVAPDAFADPDAGDTLSYSATLADGSALPSWLGFDAATRTFSGTPGALGTVSVRVTASDTSNVTASDIFDIAVSVQSLTLTGTAKADTLNGGAGNDTLSGLAGNDVLNGYAGNDFIDGGAGSDTMVGGAGDDTFIVDSAADVVVENLNEGIDSVQSSVTYTLAANVENLSLTGTAAINATGNTLDNMLSGNSAVNTLTGGAGNDRLDGKAGADKMLGGAGDDTYVVDNATDVITENANEGIDTVESSVTLTLAANVENLILTGTAALNGTGNTLDNILTGNSAANILSGGTGNDVYVFGRGGGQDTINDHDVVAGNVDTIRFGSGIAASDIVINRQGNDLVLGISGTTDQLTILGWGLGADYQIERAEFADGTIWQAADLAGMLNAAPTGSVSISGAATQNQTLTAANTLADANGLGTIGYQWQSSADNGATWNSIAGATASTFILGEAQVGQLVRVNASYTDGQGTLESVNSSATAAVANVNDAPTGTITLSGSATQNQILTATNTLSDADGLGTIGYQWQSSADNGATWSNITGALASTLVLTEAQVGKLVRVNASYTDGHGTLESVNSSATTAIANVNDAPTGTVTANGSAIQNQILTATNTLADADGLGAIGYQWQSSADNGATWSNITGASASTFALAEAQVGQLVRVNASYIDGHGTVESVNSSATTAVANVNDAPTGTVTANDSAIQNQILTATSTLADADGLGTIGYQWQSSADNGATWNSINGATASTFVLGEAQVGQLVRLNASYTDGHGTLESVSSSATTAVANVNDAPTGIVSVNGSATQNQILTATNMLTDADGLGAIGYQWQSSADNGATWSNITGALASTFVLTEAQVGKLVRVNASYTDGHGTAESVDSSATAAVANVNDAPTGTVTVSGGATQNQILTATNTLSDADGLGAIGYQWQSSADNGATWSNITGASASTFVLTEAQVGKLVRVNASYTDGHGTVESVNSSATTAVANVNNAPSGSVSVSGSAAQNQTLTAANTLADADGLGAIGYQWQSSADNGVTWSSINGATAGTFILREAQVGQLVRVNASYTDGHGTVESVNSSSTTAVVNVNDAPTVSMALADQATLQEAVFSFTVPAGIFDDVDFIHGDALSYSATLADGAALPGWLTFDAATGIFSGIPTNQDVGNLNVLVTATDTGGLSASSAFNLNVVNVNDAPTANADSGAATEDGGAVLLDVATLLANDSDPDFIHGDALNIVGVSQADSGAAVSLLNGAVQYDPSTSSGQANSTLFQSLAQGQTATDTFSYTVSDMAGATSTATVTMTITGTNDGPVTADDVASVQEDGTLTAAGNVLANDTDVDQGAVLSVANIGTLQGNYGSLSLNADGSYVYTLDNALVQFMGAGQSVTETFAYEATDGIAATPATLTVTIAGTSDVPVLATQLADQTRQQDAAFSFAVPAGSFTDIDNGDVLSYSATLADGSALPSWLSFDAATQTFSGTPGNADVGSLSIVVTATDSGGLSASSTFAVDVANVNDAPTVSVALVDQSTQQGASFSFAVPVGTFDDLDFIHGDTLSYSATLSDGSALPGWLSFDATTQTFGGTPGNGDAGSLSVIVTATDTGGLSAYSTFNFDVVNVNVNDAPTANADTGTATEDGGAVLLDAATLLANDTDPDFIHGDALNIVGVSQAASGAAVSLVNGAVQYDPSTSSGQANSTLFQSLVQGQTATDTFSYTVSDLAGATSTATVTMTVTGVNDGPVTADDTAAVQEDTILVATGNVLANDSDIDQGAVLVVANAGVFTGQYGQLTLAADGSYSYALDNASSAVQSLAAGQVVTEAFAYEATDGIASTPSTLSVSIAGANDGPVTANDTASVQEDASVTASGNVLANDSDIDQGTVLSVADAGVRAGGYGSLTLAADGGYAYSLANTSAAVQSLGRDAQVAEHFGYTATDGIASVASGLDVFLSGTNDAPILVSPLDDQYLRSDKHFSWQMPVDSFTDIDQGDVLDYTAMLADGSALPEWLEFDAATRTFSGEAPKERNTLDVRITATDKVGATGSTAGSLSASDVFRITVGRGNEGVGNGEDAPPPGHDENSNDGASASPGHPGSSGHSGSRGGNDHATDSGSHSQDSGSENRPSGRNEDRTDEHARDREDDSRNTDELIQLWFDGESASEQFSSFSLMEHNGGRGSQTEWQVNRNVEQGIGGDVASEWERMNARLKQHLEQSGGDEGNFADSGAGAGSFGLYGSSGSQNLARLGVGGSEQLQGFSGLKEGLERLAA
ncbi:MAG TPA: putative Ig domain-containing protein [Gallionella sp.]|nr:putative Ig domain-containing protein [Gallionella sp.]